MALMLDRRRLIQFRQPRTATLLETHNGDTCLGRAKCSTEDFICSVGGFCSSDRQTEEREAIHPFIAVVSADRRMPSVRPLRSIRDPSSIARIGRPRFQSPVVHGQQQQQRQRQKTGGQR